jgi:hypothetical protein
MLKFFHVGGCPCRESIYYHSEMRALLFLMKMALSKNNTQ